MDDFERLLGMHRTAVERYVKFRLPTLQDAEDVLQEVYITAYQNQQKLKDAAAFKPWLVGIARHKCADWFRKRAHRLEIPTECLEETVLVDSRLGPHEISLARETLDELDEQDRQMLQLFFWQGLTQSDIAKRLHIPLGTVKSRLHTAKEHFRAAYAPQTGEIDMKKMPSKMPAYQIEKTSLPPFAVCCEELSGWPIVPRLGEKCSWALYDQPSGKRTEYTDMEVVGKAEVHGIQGVEIVAMQHDSENYYRTGREKEIERRFVAQLTDTHCRYLAETHVENGVRKCFTFLDGEAFMNNWGFGEDNCGTETHLAPKGVLQREGNVITSNTTSCQTMDVTGRYTVTINGKKYDTVCLMDIETFDDSIASEQYIDSKGRTILWRRFNRDDWAFHRYQQKWTEKLPDNERLCINGETYVHWYDCITDYIL